jgi:two-component system, NtrC family, sensor kinase
MQRLFRFITQTIGLAPDPHARRHSAERPIRLLVTATIVVPVLLFLGVSWVSYQQHREDAIDRVQRNLGIVNEHARKVFETFDLTERYLEQILGDATDEQIRSAEAAYSRRLQVMVSALPQLRDIWIVDAKGIPLVAGTVFPMPKIDVSDREYFTVHRDGRSDGVYVSELLDARAAEVQFFSISRRRIVGGQFGGVIVISVSPDYFVDFYKTLPPPGIAALQRSDGAVLARFPDDIGPNRRLPATAPFLQAIQLNPQSGTVVATSSLDGRDRIFSYQKLQGLPLYVTAGTGEREIVRAWLSNMAEHMVFGVPAVLAMVGLGAIALRRTRRLEEEVVRRETTEQALRQAQKMEAVGRLTGGIAHDFNNMLTVILGNIDMAARRVGTDNERVERALDAARQASQRAATLVQRMLAFSRQHPQEVKAVDVNRLVQTMSELLRRTLGETVTIETVLAGGLWRVAVDPNQLENALLNLAVNARDAMPEGGKLTIETANTYLDDNYANAAGGDLTRGQYVMVAVSDTGTGMSKEVLDRAFEPFFTTKPTGMGTGLGLSMVYGFAKQSSGHIKIYSETGEGTVIKLYFPRLPANSDVPVWGADERPEAAPPAPAADNRETILLVEDDDGVREFAAETLREQGYRVIAAGDGPTALALLPNEPGIAMLFTDVVLPAGMNGRQLADAVQRQRPGLPVLFATGYTRNAIIHHGRLDADVELLTKPFTADALVRKVREILDGAMAGSQAAGS